MREFNIAFHLPFQYKWQAAPRQCHRAVFIITPEELWLIRQRNYLKKEESKKRWEVGGNDTNLGTGDARRDSDSSEKECPISAKRIADTIAKIALSHYIKSSLALIVSSPHRTVFSCSVSLLSNWWKPSFAGHSFRKGHWFGMEMIQQADQHCNITVWTIHAQDQEPISTLFAKTVQSQ